MINPIPEFLEENNDFSHQVTFTFDAENKLSGLKGSLTYSWFVNIENGNISPLDNDSKNIQQTVDYFD